MLGGIIKKLLGGDEGGANMKEINPYVEQAKSEFDKLQGISNDELKSKIRPVPKEVKGPCFRRGKNIARAWAKG